jgi:glucokinase
MLLAVFDIGGTSIKYGVLTGTGKVLMHESIPTQAYLGGESVIRKVTSIVKEIELIMKLDGIAISSAGQIDSVEGTVLHATDNIPQYSGMKIKELIEKETNLPVSIENDVNCAALGEYWKGNAQYTDDFLCITIGTGIGGALFLNGALYKGAGFAAGEIGHMTLYPDGRDCTCGNKGCFEQYASSLALEKQILKVFGEKIVPKDFFDLVRKGHDDAVLCFEKWLEDLATGLSSVIHLLNPELIVIGGGVSAQGDFLLKQVKEAVSRKVMPTFRNRVTFRMAANGNQANLLGAAKHFITEKKLEVT